MKKIMALITIALMGVSTTFAQSAKELAESQKKLDEINMKMLNMKPSKDAKKQAKEYKKQGFQVNAGSDSMEKQITYGQLLGKELMADEEGNTTRRFILQPGRSTGGTFNAAYAAARQSAMSNIAGTIETKMALAMQNAVDNAQSSAISSVTVDKFNQRGKSIVSQCLTNTIPVLTIYRILSNGNFDVQVTIAYDKKEFAARVKRNLQKELEIEGNELNSVTDDIVKGLDDM